MTKALDYLHCSPAPLLLTTARRVVAYYAFSLCALWLPQYEKAVLRLVGVPNPLALPLPQASEAGNLSTCWAKCERSVVCLCVNSRDNYVLCLLLLSLEWKRKKRTRGGVWKIFFIGVTFLLGLFFVGFWKTIHLDFFLWHTLFIGTFQFVFHFTGTF